jgi:hypothetical protein
VNLANKERIAPQQDQETTDRSYSSKQEEEDLSTVPCADIATAFQWYLAPRITAYELTVVVFGR